MAREEQQPMSDARLRDIRFGIAWARHNSDDAARKMDAWLDILDEVLADNELRRAREAALLEVVRVMAYDDPIQPDSGNFVCYYCCASAPYESAVVHGEHCVYEQARALLASDSGEAK